MGGVGDSVPAAGGPIDSTGDRGLQREVPPTSDQVATGDSNIDRRLHGTVLSRSAIEFFGKSALYPILLAIYEFASSGAASYFSEPANYVLLAAALFQAWYLGAPRSPGMVRVFFGNLSAFTLYAVADVLLEGWEFFSAPYHWVFAAFSVLMAISELARVSFEHRAGVRTGATFLSNVLRIALLPSLYVIIDMNLESVSQVSADTWRSFLASAGHEYLAIGAVMFGVLLGVTDVQRSRLARLMRATADQLKQFSAWSLGSNLIDSSFNDATVLELKRVTKTILFMDIRGFTSWSESQDADAVVTMLNRYYDVSEQAIEQGSGHKPTFTADEVMTRFDDPDQAFHTAVEMIRGLQPVLSEHGLSVGLGIHTGEVIEGVMGSRSTRKYDIIGDAVNTAKRLESSAPGGHVVLSGRTFSELTAKPQSVSRRELTAKGKREPLEVVLVRP